MMRGLIQWWRYEAKVWRHGWSRSKDAAVKAMKSLIGTSIALGIGILVVGTALGLQSVMPVIVTVLVLFLGLLVNVGLAPMRLDAEAHEYAQALIKENADLQDRLEGKKVDEEQYEALRALRDRGEELILQGGVPDWVSWENFVTNWRQRVYDALPVEKDGFWTIATPVVFKAARNGEMKLRLLSAQVEKLRKIMMRLENEIDGWNPSER